MPTGCDAYDQIDIGGKIEYRVAYGVTRCERLASDTPSHVAEWDPAREAKRIALFAACNDGVATTNAWKVMRCDHACSNHYQVRTIDSELGAEVCQTHPDGSGCVGIDFGDDYERRHWALACGPGSPPPLSPPPWPPGMAPLPPPPSPPLPPRTPPHFPGEAPRPPPPRPPPMPPQPSPPPASPPPPSPPPQPPATPLPPSTPPWAPGKAPRPPPSAPPPTSPPPSTPPYPPGKGPLPPPPSPPPFPPVPSSPPASPPPPSEPPSPPDAPPPPGLPPWAPGKAPKSPPTAPPPSSPPPGVPPHPPNAAPTPPPPEPPPFPPPPQPTGCDAYDLLGIGSKIDYHAAYGVTSCYRLTDATPEALNEWGDAHEAERLALLAACNGGEGSSHLWKYMRCNEACERHYRIRTIDGALGAEACQAHPDGSSCVDSKFADGYDRNHWALACAPSLPPPISPPPYAPGKAPQPPPP